MSPAKVARGTWRTSTTTFIEGLDQEVAELLLGR